LLDLYLQFHFLLIFAVNNCLFIGLPKGFAANFSKKRFTNKLQSIENQQNE